MTTKKRPPVPLETLKQQSSLGAAKANEYSIKSWLVAAKDSFERSAAAWRDGQKPSGDPARVEEAYVLQRRGAELLKMATSHPSYNTKEMSPADRSALRQVNEMLMESIKHREEIIRRLEQREAQWVQHEGPLARPSVGPQSTRQTNGTSRPSEARPSSSSALSHSPPSSSTHSTSPPLNSLQERMAALRAHGVAGTTNRNGPRPTAAPPAVYKPPPVVPSSSRQHDDRVAPALPPKPSHPSSPKTGARGDFVEDSAVQRSGSAPPVIPLTDGDERIGFVSLGSEIVRDRSEDMSRQRSNDGPSRYDELASLPSPTDFNVSFPSLDDFEKTVPASTSGDYNFPSVPRSPPSNQPAPASPSTVRSSLPPPPRPFEMDARDFERERRDHMEAAAALSSRQRAADVAPARTGLPPALAPGGQRTANGPSPGNQRTANGPSPASYRAPISPRPRLPPPTASSNKNFNIPPTSEIAPVQFYEYLSSSAAQKGEGPRVLLLDVRSREEFEEGRVIGETVCLEPVALRPGITSAQLEQALSLSPQHELDMFSARNNYDMVVVYDRSSMSMPGIEPVSTASEAQRVLWHLTNAIYEREFSKSLKRQPVLLKGGWEAWQKYVGSKGITRDVDDATEYTVSPHGRNSVDEFGRFEGKKTSRLAAAAPPPRSEKPPLASPSHRPEENGYFPNPAHYTPSNHSSSIANNGIISPRLAMPPTAAQRSGSLASYEAYSPSAFTPSYPQHAPQPSISGYTSVNGSPAQVSRSRGDYGDLHVQSRQSFEDYGSRPSIDYPQLQHRNAPPISRSSRPPALPPAPLARPPPAQPAPQRANSSFSGLQVGAYAASHSAFPTTISFDDQAIGLTGLKNLGNTCYMNSTIQCLSATIPFARYFKDRSYRRDINTVNPLGTKGALADAVSELVRAIWAQQYTFLSPVTFRENICRFAPQFRGSDQHDAQEFLGFLLDGLHEDLNYVLKKPAPIEMTPDREHDLETLPQQLMSEREWEIYRMRNDSFVVQCFQGQFRNQLKCLTCNKTSTTYNTFMPLSIPIPSGRSFTKASLDDCIRQFVREEILDKEDAWFCPNCKTNRKATKKLTLSRLPPILVIHLKRFSFHGPFSDKIETQIQYPLSGLDLTGYLPPPLMDKRTPQNSAPKGKVYDLFAVTNHYGNLSSGHYTAFVRSGREWHNIGDSKCTQVDPRVVESAKSAYILYYALR